MLHITTYLLLHRVSFRQLGEKFIKLQWKLRGKTCFICEKKPESWYFLSTSKKQLRFLAALQLVSYLVTQYCLRELAMPNEVVLWATVIAQQSFQTLFTWNFGKTWLSAVFLWHELTIQQFIFSCYDKGKKNFNRSPSCTCLKKFNLKNVIAPSKTQHSLVGAGILFQFITY